jgi:hypothetical protein
MRFSLCGNGDFLRRTLSLDADPTRRHPEAVLLTI